jgi:hypothetical protein
MASWEAFAQDAPDLARRVCKRFEATKHHVLATLRKDGSPRVSGTELEFEGADIFLGSMGGSVKARDLQRDPRFAIHANPGDGSMEGGDAKISGHGRGDRASLPPGIPPLPHVDRGGGADLPPPQGRSIGDRDLEAGTRGIDAREGLANGWW